MRKAIRVYGRPFGVLERVLNGSGLHPTALGSAQKGHPFGGIVEEGLPVDLVKDRILNGCGHRSLRPFGLLLWHFATTQGDVNGKMP